MTNEDKARRYSWYWARERGIADFLPIEGLPPFRLDDFLAAA